MPATKLFLAFFLPLKLTYAQDEYWSINQLKKSLNNQTSIIAEYVRRDRNTFFENKNLELARLSIGGRLHSWNYLLGAAYLDFVTANDERRLHQYLLKNCQWTDRFNSMFRIGLEQRNFINDEYLYWRFRNRLQLNYSIAEYFGLSTYDEILFSLNGDKKFSLGFNENRLGIGFHLNVKNIDIYVYQTYAIIKTLSSDTKQNWLQIQTILNF